MFKLRNPGYISLAILLSGIFFLLLIAAGAVMSSQAQASSDLEKKLNDAQSRLAQGGLKPVDVPAVRGASIDRKKKSKYSVDGLEFQYPAGLFVNEIKNDSEKGTNYDLEIVTDKKYFGVSVVPDNQLRITVKRNLAYRFDAFDDYLKLAPYATKHRQTIINGLPALIISNEFNNLFWIQAVFEHTPQGPYTVFSTQPGNTYRATDSLDIIIPTVKIMNF